MSGRERLARCGPGVPFNPNTIRMVASEDGGNMFTPARHINQGEDCGPLRYLSVRARLVGRAAAARQRLLGQRVVGQRVVGQRLLGLSLGASR